MAKKKTTPTSKKTPKKKPSTIGQREPRQRVSFNVSVLLSKMLNLFSRVSSSTPEKVLEKALTSYFKSQLSPTFKVLYKDEKGEKKGGVFFGMNKTSLLKSLNKMKFKPINIEKYEGLQEALKDLPKRTS